MNLLELPLQFQGKWTDLIILTYGMDLPFFERGIWRMLDNRCRNIIIIGDGVRYREACINYSDTNAARWINQKYIADGVYETTFHPKMILLTNSKEGRLLIGSGNLGIPGYASGGEMFSQYEYSGDQKEHISVFITARAYLDSLIEGDHIRPRTAQQIKKMYERTPWLYHGTAKLDEILRSNLDVNFLDQFIVAIDNDPIEELWIHSPFYDEKARALQKLLDKLKPQKTTILLQEGHTSIDPTALKNIIDGFNSRIELRFAEVPGGGVYIHNKLILAKTASRSICLQGSPNLSISAFLLNPPQGNFELATLRIDEREAFDHLLDYLHVEPAIEDLSNINLEFLGNQEEPQVETTENIWVLIGGEWQKDLLRVYYKGSLPDLDEALLLIGETTLNLKIMSINEIEIEIYIPQEVQDKLNQVLPIKILLLTGHESNPIYPFNLTELNNEVDLEEGDTNLGDIGDLGADDEEIENILHELNKAMIIDPQSISNIWSSGESNPLGGQVDGEELHIDYDEIDYEMLRAHPKYRQYKEWALGGAAHQKTQLQIILSSITSNFQGLIDTASGINLPDATEILIDNENDTTDQENAEEVEEQEKEKEKINRRKQARKRNIMRAFIRRYLKGISSNQFLKLVDCDVIANNYIIFSHLLWRLYSLDWMEDDFVTEAFIKMWEFMWGSTKKKGYFQSLGKEGKEITIDILINNKGLGRMISSLFYADYLSTLHNWTEMRFGLRDFWRYYLSNFPIKISLDSIIESWVLIQSMFPYDVPIPTKIVEHLTKLANLESENSFLRYLEEECNLPEFSCNFSSESVRIKRPETKEDLQIHQLELSIFSGLDTKEKAVFIYQLWSNYQPKVYYRIVTTDGKSLFLYDKEFQKGLYYNKITEVDQDLEKLPDLRSSKQDAKNTELIELGKQADEFIKLKDFSLVTI